jgi:hypothetical protein
MTEIAWSSEVAEPGNSRRYPWPDIARQCRDHEGEWGLAFRDAPISIANAVYSNKTRDVKFSQGFRVKTRNNRVEERPDGTRVRRCDIWISYRPKDEEPAGGWEQA